MEEKVVIDTGVIFDFFTDQGNNNYIETLLLERRSVISSITVFELMNGVKHKKHLQDRQEFIDLCEVYSVTREIAVQASLFYTHLRSKGIKIQNEDLLIGATAVHYDLPLLTKNLKHFLKIPELRIFSS